MIKPFIKRKIINNRFVNPILYLFGLDAWLNDQYQDYIDFKPDTSLSLQEIAGYSNKSEINQTLHSIHEKLKSTVFEDQIDKYKANYELLDIGCGPGLFLKDFQGKMNLTGIDISNAMVNIAKEELPEANIFHGHFLKYGFNKKFDAIYSIGVLIYFSKSQVEFFFKKIFDLLNDKGIVLISYPHAYREIDLGYPDFTYVNYSPNFLEKVAKGKFQILYHQHVSGTRKVSDYDHSPVENKNGFENRTYQNSSILVLRKK
jgi:SAM-dependent methyltransferase